MSNTSAGGSIERCLKRVNFRIRTALFGKQRKYAVLIKQFNVSLYLLIGHGPKNILYYISIIQYLILNEDFFRINLISVADTPNAVKSSF